MKKEDQRVTLTKRLLREGLLRILENNSDINKISVTELCRESGINRATFYKHYEAPRDVLADIEKKINNDLMTLTSDMDNDQPLVNSLEKICTYLYNNSEMVKILIRCNSDSHLERNFSEMQQTICHFNKNLSEDKQLDQDSIRLVSAFLCNGSYNLIRIWLTEEINKSPKEIAALILQIFCDSNRYIR